MTWAARPAMPALHKPTATEFDTILDRIEALGFVGESFATASTTSAAESFHVSHTFTALGSPIRYMAHFDGAAQATAGGVPALITVRIRYAAGATVTAAGTQARINAVHIPVLSSNTPVSIEGTFVPAAGQTTVGVSIFGSANLKFDFSAALVVARLGVYCVGE
jgi:hypothetical protein